jgi:creatinine amidohydrolase
LETSGVRGVSANGVLGDPAGASAAEGRALLDRVVDDLVEFVDAWGEPSALAALPEPGP